MDILNVNLNTLANLYEEFPESFKGLTIDGKYLVYNGEKVDISKFNINDLLGDSSYFTSSLSVLTPEDIFKIIRLHAIGLESLKPQKNKSEEKTELIKQENPLMRNISVVKKGQGIDTEEYFNIVDSKGNDNVFKNDRNVNIFAIYDSLKYSKPGQLVTPDELIDAIKRKLYDVNLESASTLIDRSSTTEDFKNKMKNINEKYKDDKTIKVFGNEQEDIGVINDSSQAKDHKVVTFDKNEYGDLVTKTHNQNVSGIDTKLVSDNDAQNVSSTNTLESSDSTNTIHNEKPEEDIVRLIPFDEFVSLVHSNEDFSEEQRKNVDLWYAYIGDLIIYEDYLLPELKNILVEFRAMLYDIEYNKEEIEVTANERKAVEKGHELEEKKDETTLENDPEKKKEEVAKLALRYDPDKASNTGAISTLLIILVVVVVAIILSYITMTIIS